MARLRILPAEALVESIFGIVPTESISKVFFDAGYDSHNTFRLLSFIIVNALLIALAVLLLWISTKVHLCCKTSRKEQMMTQLRWQGYTRLILLGSIEMMICPLIVFNSQYATGFSLLLSVAALLILGLVFSSLVVILLVLPNRHKEEAFKGRFNNYFELFHRRTWTGHNYMTLCYYILFMFKRATFVAILVGMRAYPTNQI